VRSSTIGARLNITILAIGSRGDVQPYVALGTGFQEAGHHVTIAAVEAFRELVERYGLNFHPTTGDVGTMLNSEAAHAAMESGGKTWKAVRELLRMAEPILEDLSNDCWEASQGSDVIIASTLGLVGLPIAEELGIPYIPAVPYPLLHPTGAFPNPAWPFDWRIPWAFRNFYNRLTHHAAAQIGWQPYRKVLNGWAKRKLGRKPYPLLGPYGTFRKEKNLTLYGYSRYVIPRPAEWDKHIQVTGYWFLPPTPDFMPPPSLVEFINSGPRPVFVGFGSMVNRETARMSQFVLDALDKAGQRAVLASGWGKLHVEALTDPERIYIVDDVPHSWLFPQMSAVVHHGGAGTTAAGLRAGVPSVIVPFFGDQPFWGRQVERLGVGPAPLPREELTSDALAERIEYVIDEPQVRLLAGSLGNHIRNEDGVSNAVLAVEAYCAGLG